MLRAAALVVVAMVCAACGSGFSFVAPQLQSDPQWVRVEAPAARSPSAKPPSNPSP